MEQPLKQRLIGAIILVSLAIIFVPMLIGQKPVKSDIVSIEIPEPPEHLNPRIFALPEQKTKTFAEVSISKKGGVSTIKTTIPGPPKAKAVEAITAWVVQVGSFSDQKNADALSAKLKKAGFTNFIEESSGKQGETYRVRVGPELNKEKADEMKMALQKEQKLSNAIVVEYP